MSNTNRDQFREKKPSGTGKSIFKKEVPHFVEEISGHESHSGINGSTITKGFVNTVSIFVNKTKPRKNKK